MQSTLPLLPSPLTQAQYQSRRPGRRPGHPHPLKWTSIMEECVDHLDCWLHEDLTNIILHYLVVDPPEGRVVCQFGSYATNGKPQNLHGVAVWKDLAFVTDTIHNCVHVHRVSDGTLVRRIGSKGSGDGQFSCPYGLAVYNDLLFVTDRHKHCVSVFHTSDGSFVRKWGSEGSESGQLMYPDGVAVGVVPESSEAGISEARVYVADSHNNRIQVFGLDGSFIRCIGSKGKSDGELSFPCGVAVSVAGSIGMLFVADWNNDRTSVFDTTNGEFIRHIGRGKGHGDGQVDGPMGVACGEGWVAVSETNYNRISVFSTIDGTFIRHWGGGGDDDSNVNMFCPRLMCTHNGLLWVADWGNYRVVAYK